jgi:hypothetical protein
MGGRPPSIGGGAPSGGGAFWHRATPDARARPSGIESNALVALNKLLASFGRSSAAGRNQVSE